MELPGYGDSRVLAIWSLRNCAFGILSLLSKYTVAMSEASGLSGPTLKSMSQMPLQCVFPMFSFHFLRAIIQ